MAVLGQGLVLLLAGMGIVFLFLVVLILTTMVACMKNGIARFDYIFPKEAPKKAPARASAGNEDANIALAIAVALG